LASDFSTKVTFSTPAQPFHGAAILLNQSADSRFLSKYLDGDALLLFNRQFSPQIFSR